MTIRNLSLLHIFKLYINEKKYNIGTESHHCGQPNVLIKLIIENKSRRL